MKLELPETIVAHAVPMARPTVGVYFLICDGRIIYVGQSSDVHARVRGHSKDHRYKFTHWSVIECPRVQLDLLESAYIHKFQPDSNRKGNKRGEKSAPLSVSQVEELGCPAD